MTPVTEWRHVGLLIGAGLLAACQVGKTALSVPQLRLDLGLGLSEVLLGHRHLRRLGAVAGLVGGALIA